MSEHAQPSITEADWAFKEPRGTMLTILAETEAPMSFKEITSRAAVKPSLCAYHLGLLQERGLIDRYYQASRARGEYSFYRISEKGLSLKRFMDRTLTGTEPARAPDEIRIIAWKNLPRCFRYGR